MQQQTTAQGTGTFRGGTANFSPYADFDQSYPPLNPTSASGSPTSYTTQAGETLFSIAQAVWGDSSLWYLLADANGLTGAENLPAGTMLSIPANVSTPHHSASTFRPYDPNQALGDLSPTTPKPVSQSSHHGCGLFGQVLLAVVAIAVTIVTEPFLGPFAPIGS